MHTKVFIYLFIFITTTNLRKKDAKQKQKGTMAATVWMPSCGQYIRRHGSLQDH